MESGLYAKIKSEAGFLAALISLGFFGTIKEAFTSYSRDNIQLFLLSISTALLLVVLLIIFIKWKNLKKRHTAFLDCIKGIGDDFQHSLESTLAKHDNKRDKDITLDGVCIKISTLFEKIISYKCTTTIKTIEKENSSYLAETYARCDIARKRDRQDKTKYLVGVNKNTAFDEAGKPSHNGNPAYFFSRDLEKEKKYDNERNGWKNLYKSTLVVPIRTANDKSYNNVRKGFIGFLCIDTLKTNKLNDKDHLTIMLAFSNLINGYFLKMHFIEEAVKEDDKHSEPKPSKAVKNTVSFL